MSRTNRRTFIKNSALGLAGLGLMTRTAGCESSSSQLPNFVIIFIDDMGYGDMTRTGNPTIQTPNLDRMADEGVMLTQFYSASPVCSPSRAALLTGRYTARTGIVRVLFPYDKLGLPDSEITLAQLLKQKGYATAAIGKWHLGHLPQYLPTKRGFDYYYGIPYSNDMDVKRRGDPPIPLMRNEEIIEQPCDQSTVTKRYTEEAIKFIEKNEDQPFFVYLPHTMAHIPLHVSEAFRGHSKRGLYGDVIEEIDWSVGQILDTLDRLELSENTLVVFTSDNGPWMIKKQDGGTAGLLRGSKGSTFEGGVREPFIARYPGKIPAGTVSSEVGTTMDLFATCLTLAGIDVPIDRPIDGKDLMPVLQSKGKSPHDILGYFWRGKLHAIRVGKYKLHFVMRGDDNKWHRCEPPQLYDLEIDPSERFDLASELPQVVENLRVEAERLVDDIERRGENAQLIHDLLNWKR